MTKEEIALELTKIVSERILRDARIEARDAKSGTAYQESIVSAYNYILENLAITDK